MMTTRSGSSHGVAPRPAGAARPRRAPESRSGPVAAPRRRPGRRRGGGVGRSGLACRAGPPLRALRATGRASAGGPPPPASARWGPAPPSGPATGRGAAVAPLARQEHREGRGPGGGRTGVARDAVLGVGVGRDQQDGGEAGVVGGERPAVPVGVVGRELAPVGGGVLGAAVVLEEETVATPVQPDDPVAVGAHPPPGAGDGVAPHHQRRPPPGAPRPVRRATRAARARATKKRSAPRVRARQRIGAGARGSVSGSRPVPYGHRAGAPRLGRIAYGRRVRAHRDPWRRVGHARSLCAGWRRSRLALQALEPEAERAAGFPPWLPSGLTGAPEGATARTSGARGDDLVR